MSSGNFTWEAWIYPTTLARSAIIGHSNDANNWVSLYLDTSYRCAFSVLSGGSVLVDFTSPSAMSVNTWTHVAISRVSNTWTIYVNGQGNSVTANQTIPDFGSAVTVGAYRFNSQADYFTGYISNVRIVKGVAVYTGNFTVPTSPLQATQVAGTNISAITGTSTSLLLNAVSSALYADTSTNCFNVTGSASPPWNTATPFATGQGLQNRVYTWSSTGSGAFTV
jgi:hypothetical protein